MEQHDTTYAMPTPRHAIRNHLRTSRQHVAPPPLQAPYPPEHTPPPKAGVVGKKASDISAGLLPRDGGGKIKERSRDVQKPRPVPGDYLQEHLRQLDGGAAVLDSHGGESGGHFSCLLLP